jgi:TolB-like protein/Tfp pilus assembly protein PilF
MSETLVCFVKELRRRRVFRVAGLYVVVIWLLMQVADIVFPAWGIPDAAIRVLLWAGLLGFPVALVFGWVFDISSAGIRRTQPVSAAELQHSLPLRRTDYLILSAFLLVVAALVYDTTGRVMETATLQEWRPSQAEIEPNSVAVLPFANLSGDAEQEYFADGISEEILNRLAAFRELKVIARTSSFAFKDSGYDIGRISGLLAVKYLLQGSVRRDGQQLRIAAQLVDQNGVQVWQQSFDRELGAIFRLQDEIAEAVATSIVPQIVPQPAESRLPDLEAYEAYLTGREILARRERNSGNRALEYFDRAIELDSGFAELYAERAVARLFQFGVDDEIDMWRDRSQRDIDRALALKPDLARAHAAQAFLMAFRDPGGSFTEREAALRRSLALDPNQVDAWNWLYSALLGLGRDEEAEQALGRALRLDPLAPAINANMAGREFRRGAIADAERRLLRVLEAPHASIPVYGGIIFLYLSTGRLVEANGMIKRFILATISATGHAPELFGMIGTNALLGRNEQAAHWRDRNIEVHPGDVMMRLQELLILSLEMGAMDYTHALGEIDQILASRTPEPVRGVPSATVLRGELLALSGDHAGALRVLGPMVQSSGVKFAGENRVRQMLAWIYALSGDGDGVAKVLEPLKNEFRNAYATGRLREFDPVAGYNNGGLPGYAMTMLLSGDEEAALGLFEEAAEAGWRGYYAVLRDPRWDALRDHPRFRAVMAKIKKDIDRQRARLEAIEADDDFEASFDAAMAAAGRR